MSFKNWKIVNWLLHWRFLKASGRLFYFKNSRPSISKYSARCLYFQLPGQLFYRHFWNLIMKLFCVISDGPYIFCYMLWKNMYFFDFVFWIFYDLKCHQLASASRHFVRQIWNLAGFFRKGFCFFAVGAIVQGYLDIPKSVRGRQLNFLLYGPIRL